RRGLGHARPIDPRETLRAPRRGAVPSGTRGGDQHRAGAAHQPVRRGRGVPDRAMSAWNLFVLGVVLGAVGGALGWFLNNRLGGRSLVAARLKAEELQRAG